MVRCPTCGAAAPAGRSSCPSCAAATTGDEYVSVPQPADGFLSAADQALISGALAGDRSFDPDGDREAALVRKLRAAVIDFYALGLLSDLDSEYVVGPMLDRLDDRPGAAPDTDAPAGAPKRDAAGDAGAPPDYGSLAFAGGLRKMLGFLYDGLGPARFEGLVCAVVEEKVREAGAEHAGVFVDPTATLDVDVEELEPLASLRARRDAGEALSPAARRLLRRVDGEDGAPAGR